MRNNYRLVSCIRACTCTVQRASTYNVQVQRTLYNQFWLADFHYFVYFLPRWSHGATPGLVRDEAGDRKPGPSIILTKRPLSPPKMPRVAQVPRAGSVRSTSGSASSSGTFKGNLKYAPNTSG